jgi:hypothetical protein
MKKLNRKKQKLKKLYNLKKTKMRLLLSIQVLSASGTTIRQLNPNWFKVSSSQLKSRL